MSDGQELPRRKLRFSLRELMVSITATAIGIGGFAADLESLIRISRHPNTNSFRSLVWIRHLSGAGFFRLFNRPILGGVIGFVVAGIVVTCLL